MRLDEYQWNPPLVTVIQERKGRSRKERPCYCCSAPIKKGEVYTYFFICDDESQPKRAFSVHQHLYCPIGDFDGY